MIGARARIAERLRRLALGNPGDAKAVGNGINELRIDYGPGYRVYYVRRGITLVILLCGGDKRTQGRGYQTGEDPRFGDLKHATANSYIRSGRISGYTH
jgi:putative addiction module killer protein